MHKLKSTIYSKETILFLNTTFKNLQESKKFPLVSYSKMILNVLDENFDDIEDINNIIKSLEFVKGIFKNELNSLNK